MINEKKCKGTGKAKGYGCNKLVPVILYGKANRVYGLGKSCKCYSTWLTSTEAGGIILERATNIGKKKADLAIKQKNRADKEKAKLDLLSPDKYRAKYVQPIINKIARYIDHGNPCTPTGNFEGKMAGGHFTSVGSNRTICLNLHNIFIQSFHSNSWKGGDDKKYRASLKRIFGEDYLDFVDSLNSHRPIQLRKPQLIEIKEKAQKIALDLEKNLKFLNAKERIQKRNEINLELGIYEHNFCEYNG